MKFGKIYKDHCENSGHELVPYKQLKQYIKNHEWSMYRKLYNDSHHNVAFHQDERVCNSIDCNFYNKIALTKIQKKYKKKFHHLSINTDESTATSLKRPEWTYFALSVFCLFIGWWTSSVSNVGSRWLKLSVFDNSVDPQWWHSILWTSVFLSVSSLCSCIFLAILLPCFYPYIWRYMTTMVIYHQRVSISVGLYALADIIYYGCYQVASLFLTITIATSFVSSSSILVMFTGWYFFQQKPNPISFLSVFVVATSLILLSISAQSNTNDTIVGWAMILISFISLVCRDTVRQQIKENGNYLGESIHWSFISFVDQTLMCFFFGMVAFLSWCITRPWAFTFPDLITRSIVQGISFSLTTITTQIAATYLPMYMVSSIRSARLMVTILLAYLMFGEALNSLETVWVVLLLLGVIILSLSSTLWQKYLERNNSRITQQSSAQPESVHRVNIVV